MQRLCLFGLGIRYPTSVCLRANEKVRVRAVEENNRLRKCILERTTSHKVHTYVQEESQLHIVQL